MSYAEQASELSHCRENMFGRWRYHFLLKRRKGIQLEGVNLNLPRAGERERVSR
jgi:hypothetical protein